MLWLLKTRHGEVLLPYFSQLFLPMPFLPLLKILLFSMVILCLLKKIPS
jgi:hypothetical protein